MKFAARITDTQVHGGTIVTGCPSVLIGGLAAARVGDAEVCPVHGPGVVVTGSPTVIIGNSFAARVGDLCGCTASSPSGEAYLGKGEAHRTCGPLGLKQTATAGAVTAEGEPGQAKKLEVVAAKATTEVYLGRPNDFGGNPIMSLGSEVTGGSAGITSDIFIGNDPQRIGGSFYASASAKAFGTKLTQRNSIEFGGYSVEFAGEGTKSELSAGVTGGGATYYDKKEQRFHMMGAAKLEAGFGLGLLGRLSIGKKYPPGEPPPPGGGSVSGPSAGGGFTGSAGVPAVIMTGRANVLIG
jgi:uncharacterized Zn-binding protein involved in type VI secretion